MMRSAKAQWKPTSLQWALIVVSLVIVLVTALWPSSADREPGLFGIATRPGSAPARATKIVPHAAPAPSSAQVRMAPSQQLKTRRPADCHPPRLTNSPRSEC